MSLTMRVDCHLTHRKALLGLNHFPGLDSLDSRTGLDYLAAPASSRGDSTFSGCFPRLDVFTGTPFGRRVASMDLHAGPCLPDGSHHLGRPDQQAGPSLNVATRQSCQGLALRQQELPMDFSGKLARSSHLGYACLQSRMPTVSRHACTTQEDSIALLLSSLDSRLPASTPGFTICLTGFSWAEVERTPLWLRTILGFSLFLLGLAQTGLPCFSPWPPWTSGGTISAWYTGLPDLDCRCDWTHLCDFLRHDTRWTDNSFATPGTGLWPMAGNWCRHGFLDICFPSAVKSGRRDLLQQVCS
jgi:hypothetical protein